MRSVVSGLAQNVLRSSSVQTKIQGLELGARAMGRHAPNRLISPISMSLCGGALVSRSLTNVRTAPRAQVVEKMALGGLAAATPREPACKCCGGWVLLVNWLMARRT